MKTTLDQARAARRALAEQLASSPEVNGIGITRNGTSYALKVNLIAPANVRVPKRVRGVSVSVDVVGPAVPT